MGQIQTIFKNMSWLFVSEIITSILAFFWTILIARYLGVSNYGIMGFAISFTGIIKIIMDFGISTHVVRHIATDYDSAPKYLGNVIPLKSLFALGSFGLVLIILVLMGADELTIHITLLFTLQQVFLSMNGLLMGVFQAFENGKFQAISNLASNVLLLIFILISVFFDFGIYGVSAAYALSNVVIVFYGYFVLKRDITVPEFELDWEFCKKITMLSIPFALTAIFSTVYYSIDSVMITHMVGSYANGIYSAAYKIISVITVFYSVYGAVIFPVMNKLFKNEKDLLKIVFGKSVKYLVLIMIPLATAIMFYSTDIVHLIYGNDYLSADACLSILVWTVCLLFVNGAGATLLNASHREKSVTMIYLIAAVFNFSVNIFIIPRYSFIGASISTVLSDLLILILMLYVIHKVGSMPDKRILLDLIKVIIASVVLYVVLSILNISMWLAFPVGVIIYFTTVYCLKIFDDEDKHVLKDILGK